VPEDIPEDLGFLPNPIPEPPQKKPDIGMLALFIGILLAGFFTLLPMNHVEINWECSAIAYLAIIIGAVWTFLVHGVPHRGKDIQMIGSLVLVAALGASAMFATLRQYNTQHPKVPMLTIAAQTLPGLPVGMSNNPHLRYHQILIQNANDIEIENFISRLQLPEPISTTVETQLPPGIVIGWEPLLTRFSITGTGNRSYIGPNSTRNYLLPMPHFFPGNHAQLTGYSEGGDLTGVWQLTIDKLPPKSVALISFLTMNDGDATNYIALANTEFKTNGAAISTTMRGDGNGGAIVMSFTMAMIINTNYANNPREDWHFGTNWLRFYFEGLYQYPAAGKTGSQNFLVPFVFDTNSRAISSFPIKTEDGNWRRVMIEYQ
jgi:hypothetical protein